MSFKASQKKIVSYNEFISIWYEIKFSFLTAGELISPSKAIKHIFGRKEIIGLTIVSLKLVIVILIDCHFGDMA